jgi:hypothetical protein
MAQRQQLLRAVISRNKDVEALLIANGQQLVEKVYRFCEAQLW